MKTRPIIVGIVAAIVGWWITTHQLATIYRGSLSTATGTTSVQTLATIHDSPLSTVAGTTAAHAIGVFVGLILGFAAVRLDTLLAAERSTETGSNDIVPRSTAHSIMHQGFLLIVSLAGGLILAMIVWALPLFVLGQLWSEQPAKDLFFLEIPLYATILLIAILIFRQLIRKQNSPTEGSL